MKCQLRATIALSEVHELPNGRVGLLPHGQFCDHHWREERDRLRSEGLRTAMSMVKGPRTPCDWSPPVPDDPRWQQRHPTA